MDIRCGSDSEQGAITGSGSAYLDFIIGSTTDDSKWILRYIYKGGGKIDCVYMRSEFNCIAVHCRGNGLTESIGTAIGA